ncbi:DNA-methyltransferase [Chimaeribacter arupi]|uniref:DNA-methyltransferase n=1 Tax=Chimaeribacter arupi TaxID=2060066 RepID=UPI000C7AA3B3|nr:site-specific DNA-methyltransferase [Chimaeribacter arupi]PLR44900.1 site-specific DNA-methyltransferase [Chimaeribacter arupi]
MLQIPSSQSTLCLYNQDAVEWLRSIPNESIDLLITDPPYESLEKHRKIGTTTRLAISKSSSNQWFKIFPNERFEELFTEIYRVLKKNTHFYLFCDQETAFFVKPIAERAGFRFWKPIVWDKVRLGMGYHYRARYEFILFFEKGKRKLNDLSIPDVLAVPRVNKGYPTEKPVLLLEILVKQSTIEGELICDPFMGACSTGVASLNLNRRFFGNDLSDYALEISRERLNII